MFNVVICVCTRKRPEGIVMLLKSIEKMAIPVNVQVRIVVVENDSHSFSENAIKDSIRSNKICISYFLETRQGIAYARNRSVKEAGDCDFCCFVDDDQCVSELWLSELLRCQKEFDADAVWGPNPPVFKGEVPSYIKKFHAPEYLDYGTIVMKAHTNCLLIKKAWLDKIEGPFDLNLNFSGGEDTFLTSLITKNGGIIRFNPNAIAYEIIPAARTTIKYVIKRSIRMTNTRFFYQSLLDENFSRLKLLPELIARLGYGILIVLPCFLFLKENKLKGIIKICDAMGGIFFILGKMNTFYR